MSSQLNSNKSNNHDDLKQLLKSWKLERILSHLIDEEVNVDVLKIIKLSHIKPLLCGFPFGTQILFEHNLEQWRHKIGKPLKQQACPDETKIKQSGQNNVTHNTAAAVKESGSSASINLREILLQSIPDGPELLEIYSKNHAFSKPERNHLINIIVNYYLKHDMPFNLQTSYALEESISSLFPNEMLVMYRDAKQSKLYTKYLATKAAYNKPELPDFSEDCSSDDIKILPNSEQSMLIPIDNYGEETTVNDVPTEIVLQAIYGGVKKFIKIYDPFLYEDFFLVVCSLFNIENKDDFYVAVNGCEISTDDFRNVVLQYYKLPSFTIELMEKLLPLSALKTEDTEKSEPASNLLTPTKSFESNTTRKTSVQIIYNYLPDAEDIRNMPALFHIIKMYDDGKMLENKHRDTIVKAIIDECLNFQPQRVLKRQDFYALTRNLITAFPKEVESTYFIPSQPNFHARGKLWNAYNNKRRLLATSGVLERRHRDANGKRKHQSDGESDKPGEKIYITGLPKESHEFSLYSLLDWDTIKQRWTETHHERRDELLREKLQPAEYMHKYSILKSSSGVELMEIDVNIMHPTVGDVNNWLAFYHKIVDRARTMRKVDAIPKILESIDTSNDERYRASMALLIVPFIFPFNTKRTRCDIQRRFIKEYETINDLKNESECEELQLRFVHTDQQIKYAEFKICDYVFKCADLLDALNSVFFYKVAISVDYPRICLHIWQFIQLAVFQIEITECLQPNVESTFNDLCMA